MAEISARNSARNRRMSVSPDASDSGRPRALGMSSSRKATRSSEDTGSILHSSSARQFCAARTSPGMPLEGVCHRASWHQRAEGARIPAMRTISAWAAVAFLGAGTFIAAQSSAPPPADARFRDIPEAANIRGYMQRLSARPHHVGSAYAKDNAEWMLAKFKEWGWDASIERFDVLFPTPKERVLELVEPTKFTAKLDEPVVSVDATSGQKSEQLPSYNAYSIDGDVTAPLVYANFGRVEDYERLERMGVSARGTIVVVRYGQIFRGVKAKIAFEHGAAGCLIYSDPKDDGFAAGPVFPNGPMRPSDGVQRGSVEDLGSAAGDPLTIGIGSVPGARRTPI